MNAFWSITMYDGRTQLLVENPIHRYLINSPMRPELKKNADGSLTVYIQKDSPGKDKESNWLPAPEARCSSSCASTGRRRAALGLPARQGDLETAALVPARNLSALDVKRFGDKSLENFIRTERATATTACSRARAAGATGIISNIQADPEPQPLAGHAVDLLHRRPRAAGREHSDVQRYLSARPLPPVRALQSRAGTFVSVGEALEGPDFEPEPARPIPSGSAPTGSPTSATSRSASWPRTRRRTQTPRAKHALRGERRRRV